MSELNDDLQKSNDDLQKSFENLQYGGKTASERMHNLRYSLERVTREIGRDLLPVLRVLEIRDPALVQALENALTELDRHLASFTLEYSYRENRNDR